jgi:hypothetical protein
MTPKDPSKKISPKPLSLVRSSRRLASEDFNALTVEERLRLVRNASGKKKYGLLLDARDSEELVRRLPAQEAYLLIKDLGVEDCVELLAMMSTEQLTTLFDLDFWEGEELKPRSVLEWLAMLLETGEDKVVATACEMDLELLTLMMRQFITITRGLESLTDEDALAQGRSERIYEMDFADSESAKIVGHFLDILYSRERDFFLLLMEAVRHEVGPDIEDAAFTSRSIRLQELGFPDPFEALGVFAYLPPEQFTLEARRKLPFRPGEEGVEAPGFFLAVPAGHLLEEVLSRGLEPGACWELTYLLNKVMIAERIDISDVEQVGGAMGKVYRYLNIALEYLSEGEFEQALRFFDNSYFEHLFRLGLSLTLDLKKRAEKVRGMAPAFYLDASFQGFVDALCRKRPQLYVGAVEAQQTGERPFSELKEVQACSRWLDRLEAQMHLFDGRLGFAVPDPQTWDLSGCLPGNPEDVALSDLFLTGLANRLLKRPFAPEPLSSKDLVHLWEQVAGDRQGLLSLRGETVAWAESLAGGAGDFADHCLDLWAEGLCVLERRDLDPRFVSGLIVRLRD